MKNNYFIVILFSIVSVMIIISSCVYSLNITLSSTVFVSSIINVVLFYILYYTSHLIYNIYEKI